MIYGTCVKEITKDGLIVCPREAMGLESRLNADLIIATLGIQQAPLLGCIGPDLLEIKPASKRLLVKETLQSKSNSAIFALGDCSRIDGVNAPSTAQVAIQQADIVSQNILLQTS